jgi:hypothetical protein
MRQAWLQEIDEYYVQVHCPCNDEVLKNDKMRIRYFQSTGMLMTLDGSKEDMIRPRGLTIPVIVPQGADLTADDDDFNRIAEDEIDNRNGWDDDVECR